MNLKKLNLLVVLLFSGSLLSAQTSNLCQGAYYSEQEGKCPCCGEFRSNTGINGLVVDHCHTTGKIRQLLCSSCNTALGLLKEKEDTILNLLDYVRKHNG